MKHDVYHALGNKARSTILLCLMQKSRNVTELITSCGLAQSAVSQHLAKLRQAGLIRAQKDGKTVRYSLLHKKAATISKLLQTLQKEVS